jgi:hypothetical protein
MIATRIDNAHDTAFNLSGRTRQNRTARLGSRFIDCIVHFLGILAPAFCEGLDRFLILLVEKVHIKNPTYFHYAMRGTSLLDPQRELSRLKRHSRNPIRNHGIDIILSS